MRFYLCHWCFKLGQELLGMFTGWKFRGRYALSNCQARPFSLLLRFTLAFLTTQIWGALRLSSLLLVCVASIVKVRGTILPFTFIDGYFVLFCLLKYNFLQSSVFSTPQKWFDFGETEHSLLRGSIWSNLLLSTTMTCNWWSFLTFPWDRNWTILMLIDLCDLGVESDTCSDGHYWLWRGTLLNWLVK